MAQDSSLLDIPVNSLRGDPASLGDHKGKVLLIVNVASKCGLTPQYTGLEELHERYADRGFAVLGFPCNQFGAQEPGSPEEIATFCSTTYGVTFPMYREDRRQRRAPPPDLRGADPGADAEGNTGDIRWNFEKFLVSPTGDVIARFSPIVTPEAPELVDAIEAALPS